MKFVWKKIFVRVVLNGNRALWSYIRNLSFILNIISKKHLINNTIFSLLNFAEQQFGIFNNINIEFVEKTNYNNKYNNISYGQKRSN